MPQHSRAPEHRGILRRPARDDRSNGRNGNAKRRPPYRRSPITSCPSRWKHFWKLDLEEGFRLLRNGLHSHFITARFAAALMIKRRRGRIVEIGDGEGLDYRATLFFDLVKTSVNRLAYAIAEDLRKYRVAALASHRDTCALR